MENTVTTNPRMSPQTLIVGDKITNGFRIMSIDESLQTDEKRLGVMIFKNDENDFPRFLIKLRKNGKLVPATKEEEQTLFMGMHVFLKSLYDTATESIIVPESLS